MAAQKPVKKTAAPKATASATKSSASAPAKATRAASKAKPPAEVQSAAQGAVATAAPKPAKKAAKAVVAPADPGMPVVKGTTKEGIAYTKDFDVKFLTVQKAALLQQRAELVGQATRLEDEANSLIEEQEMGDVEFGDEGGEGDTMVVERERDLALSAQARQMVDDIDAALGRLSEGTYGYSLLSWRPIPRERLEAIPWATALVEEKVGGFGRR
jgi:RNA polymerase-binding transcription factor DksA